MDNSCVNFQGPSTMIGVQVALNTSESFLRAPLTLVTVYCSLRVIFLALESDIDNRLLSPYLSQAAK